jgi:hypothetical protein
VDQKVKGGDFHWAVEGELSQEGQEGLVVVVQQQQPCIAGSTVRKPHSHLNMFSKVKKGETILKLTISRIGICPSSSPLLSIVLSILSGIIGSSSWAACTWCRSGCWT